LISSANLKYGIIKEYALLEMKKITLLLLGIVFLAAVLRFWQLSENPPSLTWDEAAWGYNAYSLGTDGKDEFGRFLPLDYLESFGDFKPPAYAYLDILPIKIFGVNEFAVRVPSAFFGTLTVLATYFLVKRILQNGTKKPESETHEYVALFTALLLTISPWHINLSRAAFEANVASFFIVFGVWMFLEWVHGYKWGLLLSASSFVISMYTFNTARVVAPLLVLMLAIGFKKQLLLRKKETILALAIGIILILPTTKFLISPQANLRFREVNIFSDINLIKQSNQEILNDNNAWWSKIVHNRRLIFTVAYINHYFDNLNPSFLFIKGDGNPKFSTQDVGQLYIWEVPFLIGGLILLIKKREGWWWVIPLWLTIGIIPAATARETPHALRIETTLPTFQFLTAYGFFSLMKLVSKIKYQISKIQIRYLIFSLCILFLTFNFLYYLHGYYTHYPREFSGEWQYGYKESIMFAETVQDQYNKIYVTTILGRPYIYYLFYTQTHPLDFRTNSDVKRDVFGFVEVDRFGKYYFAQDLHKLNSSENNILYINIPKEVPVQAHIIRKFNLLNDEPALVAYTL